ncbi:hypothetical protein TNCV_24991 [Trichonephila clavipes]|uniref:Uncharacterized protein n=1 Tax=Trichonephila clavipes TaxID=2585209 RepID=A0A8X6W1N9_TRICX|nr:hypothetical protein TNCV_24991 [Trichonephila clavipes]
MVQKGREKEQKQQHITGTENILSKGCTTTGVRQFTDIFFWIHIKSSVFGMPVPSVEGIARISVAAERTCDMPGIFHNKSAVAFRQASHSLLRKVTNSVREKRCRLIMKPVQNYGLYVIVDPLGFSSVAQRCDSRKATVLHCKLNVPVLPTFYGPVPRHTFWWHAALHCRTE